ncbi:MAG: PIG-L deacetylase family protein [Anaerolineaceae bacterium]
MDWVFLSPHYDDAIFSCGGLIWQQAAAGSRVEILTICGGEPPDGPLSPFAEILHRRWGLGREVAASRRAEDAAACSAAGAFQSWLDIPDCIYRTHPKTGEALIQSNDDLFLPEPPHESTVLAAIAAALSALPPETRLVCPLAVGGHIDHRLVRRAAQALNRPLWFYGDFPYSARKDASAEDLVLPGARPEKYELNQTAIEQWVEAAARYRSQLSTFWKSRQELAQAISSYFNTNPFGHTLWSYENK